MKLLLSSDKHVIFWAKIAHVQVRNSKEERLLAVIIDRDFMYDEDNLDHFYKATRKLEVLTRICKFD